MQKQNLCQGGFMPKNRQHYRKIKYPDKVTKQKRLVFVRIFLFSSVGSRNAYFPTAPFHFYVLHNLSCHISTEQRFRIAYGYFRIYNVLTDGERSHIDNFYK